MIDSKNIVTFNTGRQYSDKGQRIAAVKLPDGRVAFWDIDRGIDGITNIKMDEATKVLEKIPAYDRYLYDVRLVKGFAMACYDFGEYLSGADYDSTRTYGWEDLRVMKEALWDAARQL